LLFILRSRERDKSSFKISTIFEYKLSKDFWRWARAYWVSEKDVFPIVIAMIQIPKSLTIITKNAHPKATVQLAKGGHIRSVQLKGLY
jgi:hypothetical protein